MTEDRDPMTTSRRQLIRHSGWDPAPHAVLSVAAELITLSACGFWWFGLRRVIV
jgi:hypothetical protein